jgi:hypothetical protein
MDEKKIIVACCLLRTAKKSRSKVKTVKLKCGACHRPVVMCVSTFRIFSRTGMKPDPRCEECIRYVDPSNTMFLSSATQEQKEDLSTLLGREMTPQEHLATTIDIISSMGKKVESN